MTLTQPPPAQSDNTKAIITVAVPVPLFRLFDYLPETKARLETNTNPDNHKQLPQQYSKGQRVLVPFAGRSLIGIIIQISYTTEASLSKHKLKHIYRCYDEEPAFSETLLSLLHWASNYYCHPLGDCLHAALPTALRRPSNTKSKTAEKITVTKWHRSTQAFNGRKNATKQLAILDTVAKQANGIWQEALKSMGYPVKQLKQLEDSGYLYSEVFDPLTASVEQHKAQVQPQITLNPAQIDAIEQLSGKPDSFQVSLLQGVTGSGKTEVYIERAKLALSNNQQALILIPEINLTPQTLSRFQNQLATPIGLIHSGMSSREKLTTWHLARQGTAKVIVGTRSAIFTPFKNLGLIVVDEEHDNSYKQIDNFKYSARDLAVKRGQLENCQVILGSATPSLESMHNAIQGKYRHIKMMYRAGAGQTPEMFLIDIRSRPLENGCSRPLLNRIGEEIEKGNQVIIFQNRRGFSPSLMCNSCGWLAQCKHCDARLTVHSQPPHLHCHHCDYKEAIPGHCESCKYQHLSPLGSGTERIEYGLTNTFPNTKVIRIDRDRIKKQADMKLLIEDINKGEPCLLVGTQMLAKGHDFHNVTLVAIIDADASFFSADFRAIERSAQQLLQVAGRTGRGNKAGTVLIQTRQPEHPLFTPILASDYNHIVELELADRECCELPPYSKMITLRSESDIQENAFNSLSAINTKLQTQYATTPSFQISGPIEASIARKAGTYRCYLHLFISDMKLRTSVLATLPELLSQRQKGKTKLSVDVDPLDYI